MSHGTTLAPAARAPRTLADFPALCDVIREFIVEFCTVQSSKIRDQMLGDALRCGTLNDCFAYVCDAGMLTHADALQFAYLLAHLPAAVCAALGEYEELSDAQIAERGALGAPGAPGFDANLAMHTVRTSMDIAHEAAVSDRVEAALDDSDDSDDSDDDSDDESDDDDAGGARGKKAA